MKKLPPIAKLSHGPIHDQAEEDLWRLDDNLRELEEIIRRESAGRPAIDVMPRETSVGEDHIAFVAADTGAWVRVLKVIVQGSEAYQELATLVGHPSARKHWLAMCRHTGAGAPRGSRDPRQDALLLRSYDEVALKDPAGAKSGALPRLLAKRIANGTPRGYWGNSAASIEKHIRALLKQRDRGSAGGPAEENAHI